MKVRNEVQEYPKKPLMDALTAKLKMQVITVRKLLKLDFDTLIVKAMINLNSQKKEVIMVRLMKVFLYYY